jgi:hypothetical protein
MTKTNKINSEISKQHLDESKSKSKSKSNNSKSKSNNSKSKSNSSKKLNVILDIDETLLYFIQKRYQSYSWDTLSNEEKNKYKDNIRSYKNGNLLILRPNLDKFLKFLFKNCNVSIWTASEFEYAEFIVEQFILPYGIPKYVLSERQGELSRELHGNTKDLNLLWYGTDRSYSGDSSRLIYKGFNESNTILIDDLPQATQNPSNKKNSIAITRFGLFGEAKDRSDPYRDVSKDDALLQTIDLLRKLIVFRKITNKIEPSEFIFSDNNIKKIKEFFNNNNNSNSNSNSGIDNYIKTIKYKKKNINAIAIGNTSHFRGGANIKTKHITKLASVGILGLLTLAGSL